MKHVQKAAPQPGRGWGVEVEVAGKGEDLNIEKQVSGRSEGMDFPAEPELMECVTTERKDTVSD